MLNTSHDRIGQRCLSLLRSLCHKTLYLHQVDIQLYFNLLAQKFNIVSVHCPNRLIIYELLRKLVNQWLLVIKKGNFY